MVKMKNNRHIVKSFVLVLLFILCLTGSVFASESWEEVVIGQVSINKPEIIVYFEVFDEYSDDLGTVVTAGSEILVDAMLGTETLTLVSLEPFRAGIDNIWYIFTVDCSTSMTSSQMEAIRNSINGVTESMSSGDKVTIITFGVDVGVLVSLSEDIEEISAAVSSIRADQNGTLFYDALIEVMNQGNRHGEGIPDRRVAFVISDAEDYNIGGFIKDEVDARLENAPVAIYAIGLNNNTRAALDAFGAMARLSGGSIDVVTHTTMREVVSSRASSFRSGYVAHFVSRTNIITGNNEDLMLTVTRGDAIATTRVNITPSRWIPDLTPPEIISAEQVTSGTIHIEFSEPVLGADIAASYRILDTDGNLLAIRAVSYDKQTNTAIITLAELPPGGEISISYPGITDESMEVNAISESSQILWKGMTPTDEDDMQELQAYEEPQEDEEKEEKSATLLIIGLIVAGIAIAVTIIIIIKKRTRNSIAAEMQNGNKRETIIVSGDESEAVKHKFVTMKPLTLNLRVIDGFGNMKDISALVSGSLIVGRADGNDIVFDDAQMSRQHFVIEANENGLIISNLSKSMGTLLNGVPIGAPRPIMEGDKIGAGSMTLIVTKVVS